MKLNYEEMKESFGVLYEFNPNSKNIEINEIFNSSYNKNSYQFKSLEEAKLKYEEFLKEKFLKEKMYLVSKLEGLKNLPWLINIFKRKRIKEVENKINLLNLNSYLDINIRYLNKDVEYELDSSRIVRECDIFYIVVIKKNLLEEGVYKAFVKEALYIDLGYNKTKYRFSGVLKVNLENDSHQFNFKVDGIGFTSCYANHYLFINESEAIKFMKKSFDKNLNNSVLKPSTVVL